MSVMAVMHRIRLDHLQTFFCKFTDGRLASASGSVGFSALRSDFSNYDCSINDLKANVIPTFADRGLA